MKDSVKGATNAMEVTKACCAAVPNNHDSDKHTAFIDLSNKCREFYQARLMAAEAVKFKLDSNSDNRNWTPKKKNSIDTAMETLRTEMASLMEQDLSLMKQLLTLNEKIEELKWQQKFYYSQTSMRGSSRDLNESDWSVSETDMYDLEREMPRKYPTPSALSLQSWLSKREDFEEDQIETHENILNLRLHSDNNNCCEKRHVRYLSNGKRSVETEFLVTCDVNDSHEEHNSFDSGIYEPVKSNDTAV